jgi:hypothetical protein
MGDLQIFVGEKRFQPWFDSSKTRLWNALQGAEFFGWDIIVPTLRWSVKQQNRYGYSDQAFASFLKKIPISDASTLLGKVALSKPQYQAEFFRERMNTWIRNKREWNNVNGVNSFESIMDKIDKILWYGDKKVVRSISFREYLADRTWMKSGVVSQQWKDLIPKGYNTTKSSLAVFNTTDKIVQRLNDNMEKGSFHWTIHAKPEPNKTRATIVDIFDLYIYMSYVSYFIVPWLGNNQFLMQTLDNDRKYSFWRYCQWNTHIGNSAIDLDYSTWDELITLDAVRTIVNKLCDLAIGLGYHRDLKNIKTRINHILDVADILIIGEDEDEYIPWNNGLITGFLWTWLINGLVNAGLQWFVLDQLDLERYKTTSGAR